MIRRLVLSLAALLLVLGAVRPATLQAQAGKPRVLTHWDTVARDLFRELIEINTQESNGSTLAAAEAMAKHLKAAGFPDADVTVLSNAPRKGNLIARLRGKKLGKKPVLLLSHIDVVEAKPEDWTLPPYTFIEKDTTFYGRGVSDDKDDGAIHLALIMRFKAEKFVPDRDIIVALTTDEEGGPANGVDWLIKNHRDLIDAEFAFNEGGGGRVKNGKKLSHDIQASEKKVQNFQLEATNPGGHSSRPVKDNAIYELAAALTAIGTYDFPVHLNDITRTYFERSAAITEGPIGPAMKALVANPKDVAAAALISSDPSYNSQLRTSCVATMLDGGHALNALPQRARGFVNCRILPDENPDSIQAQLQRLAGDKVKVTKTRGVAENSPPSIAAGQVMAEIERATKDMWPGVAVIPTMSTGATDGRFLRSSGIPTYGVSGQFYGDSNAHGMNEHIPQRGFYEAGEFMYRLMKSLTGSPIS